MGDHGDGRLDLTGTQDVQRRLHERADHHPGEHLGIEPGELATVHPGLQQALDQAERILVVGTSGSVERRGQVRMVYQVAQVVKVPIITVTTRLPGSASEEVETQYPKPPEFVAQGDRVLVVGVATGKIKATNRAFKDDWVFAITVRNGKVTKIREYIDTQALARASVATHGNGYQGK